MSPPLLRLRGVVAELDRVVVAWSGGVDSSLVAWVAHDVLGPDRVRAVTAVSASLAADERAACAQLADAWGLRWTEIHTDEMANAAYRRNDRDRCWWCKDALMDALVPIAEAERGPDQQGAGATIVLGVNTSDLGDHRPGQEAAAARGARFPLVEAGLDKDGVREVSRTLGLQTWDKPAAPCLASRLPYGTTVTLTRLSAVERAEAALRRMGFADLRVRHYESTARLEVPVDDLHRVVDERDRVVAAVAAAGFRYVTLDLQGLRSGNLNG